MTSVGDTLRRERLKRHLELDQISRELKISARMLEAIEEEKFDRLPGGVFAKSFIRQYARLLGLDEEELAGQAQRMIEPVASVPAFSSPPAAPAAPIHVPRVEAWDSYEDKGFSWGSWMPAAAMVIVAMLVCSGVYGWWQHTKRVVAVPEPVPAPAEAAQVSPPQSAPTTPPAAVDPAPAADTSAAASTVAPDAPPPAAPAVQSAAPPQTVAVVQSTATGNPNTAVRVELTAEESVWVSARADGKYVFSGVLNPNQTRTVEAHETLVIRVGNAGGLSVTLNGKPVGSLGAKGQARTVQFTPGGFQIVAAPKPPLPL